MWNPIAEQQSVQLISNPSLDVSANYTTFVVGRSYELNWRQLYGHEGGMQINLLSNNGSFVETVAPEENFNEQFFDAPPSQVQEQTREVKFKHTCRRCQLQILKKAEERSMDFVYFSCSPVDIIDSIEENARQNDDTECNRNGEWKSEGCVCDDQHVGVACEIKGNLSTRISKQQFLVDCKFNTDCGDNGICRKQENSDISQICFCEFGRFGTNCEKDSAFNKTSDHCFNTAGHNSQDGADYISYGLFDESCYKQTAVTSNDFVYSRVIGNELEVILDFDTVSYAAIGWKPINLTNECRTFPLNSIENGGFTESAFNAPLHPMSCADVVYAMVIDDTKLHIRDAYSRGDTSTPLPDEHFNGVNSLSAAFGIQIVGRTIVMFRRPISTNEPTDHSLNGQLFGIYSKGQKHGERKWITETTLQNAKNRDRVFYREDEFAYHGEDNRGTATFEFVDSQTIENSANFCASSLIFSSILWLIVNIREFE
ncbi:DOMON domain-containing protein [Aphelenchoides besseyi]|nr:DOMON domain-containing protein [Aphelenchoides besseyi]